MSTSTLRLTDDLRAYLLKSGVREPQVLAALRMETALRDDAVMQIAPEQGAFMAMLVRLMGARQILEVGTYTGYSSTAMALAAGPGSRITCCDISEETSSVARRAWQDAGVDDRMELRLADALETLEALIDEGRGETYDLAFVDADKQRYQSYHERCLELIRPGGALLYDNVLWSGAVIDSSDQESSTVALRRFNEALRVDTRVELSMLPLGDGLTVCCKR